MRMSTARNLAAAWIVVAWGLSCACGQEAAEQPAEAPADGRTVVRVATAQELLKAIGPRRVIELAAGRYDLTPLRRTLLPHVRWEEAHDGQYALIVRKLEGLTLRGPAATASAAGVPAPTAEIIVQTPYTFVLSFEQCSEVTLERLKLGHARGGYCIGGVVAARDCTSLRLADCVLYGCGTEGLQLERVKHLEMVRSVIEDCTYGILSASQCERLVMVECAFRRNVQFHGLDLTDCTHVSLVNCRIHDNVLGGLKSPLFKTNLTDPTHRMTMQGGEIRDNAAHALTNEPTMLVLKDVKVTGNSWQVPPEVAARRGRKTPRDEGGWIYHADLGDSQFHWVARKVYGHERLDEATKLLIEANSTLREPIRPDTRIICPPMGEKKEDG